MRVGGGSWIWRQGDPLTTWIAFFGSMIKIRTITSSFYMDIHLFIKFFRVWREVYLAFHKWSSFSLQTMSPGPGAKQELTELCPVVEICSVLSLRDMGQSGESEMWLLGHSGWYCEAGIKESQSFCLTLGMALHEATTANNLCPLPTLIFFFSCGGNSSQDIFQEKLAIRKQNGEAGLCSGALPPASYWAELSPLSLMTASKGQ